MNLAGPLSHLEYVLWKETLMESCMQEACLGMVSGDNNCKKVMKADSGREKLADKLQLRPQNLLQGACS